jgi:hypothetical protein
MKKLRNPTNKLLPNLSIFRASIFYNTQYELQIQYQVGYTGLYDVWKNSNYVIWRKYGYCAGNHQVDKPRLFLVMNAKELDKVILVQLFYFVTVADLTRAKQRF